MTVAEGCAILVLAAAIGVGAGYLLGRREGQQFSAGYDDGYDDGYTARDADTEDLLRKGGPPTPEAMNDTDNTQTPGNSDSTDTATDTATDMGPYPDPHPKGTDSYPEAQ